MHKALCRAVAHLVVVLGVGAASTAFSEVAVIGTSLTTGGCLGPCLPKRVELARVDLSLGHVDPAPALPCTPHCHYAQEGFRPGVAVADRTGAQVLFPYTGIVPSDPGRYETGWGHASVADGSLAGVDVTGIGAGAVQRHAWLDELLTTQWVSLPSVSWWDDSSLTAPALTMALTTDTYGGSFSPLVFSRDGRDAFVTFAERLYRIDTLTRRTVVSRSTGYFQSLGVDPYRGWVYGIAFPGPALVAYDPVTLEEAWRMPIDGFPPEFAMLAVHGFDGRGRLLIDVRLANPFRGQVLVIDPDRRAVADLIYVEGAQFVPGSRSGRLYRRGWIECFVPNVPSCRGDVLYEYDAADLKLLKWIALDQRPADDSTREYFRAQLNWIAFVPRTGRAIEFRHDALDRYFITADDTEIKALDTGAFPGWLRTGESFRVLTVDAGYGATRVPVCRYLSRPGRGIDSHVYAASARECNDIADRFGADWMLESRDVFQVALPDPVTGACQPGTVPVYRLWNARADTNHRYTTSTAIKAEMVAAGHVPEGYGPDAVAFCAEA